MSMPSSRLLVATTAGSRPPLSAFSISARCSLLTEPWWARARMGGAPDDAPDCAMISAGERVCRSAPRSVRHHPSVRLGSSRPRWSSRPPGRLVGGGQAFFPDLVEPGGQPLGQPPRVGEHQRGAVRRDEVDDALLDVWPDRGPALLPGRGTAEVLGQLAERGHVGQRYDDLEVPLLGRRRLHDLDRTAAGEIAGHLLHGANGRRQPDALRRFREQLVETLQRQRQVRAPLGTRHRVDLVDDDRLHAGERLSGARGEHEEQRLRSGDEDVGRRPDECPTVGGGGVAGADRDGDVGRRQSEPGGGVSDPDERGPQVALDVDGQGLERRDVEDPAALLRSTRAVHRWPAGRAPRGRPTASCPNRSAPPRGRDAPS